MSTNRAWRKISIVEGLDGGWWYRVSSAPGKIVYNSETFRRKSYAIKAARREHSGRSNFVYLLEYPDRNGVLVRETL